MVSFMLLFLVIVLGGGWLSCIWTGFREVWLSRSDRFFGIFCSLCICVVILGIFIGILCMQGR